MGCNAFLGGEWKLADNAEVVELRPVEPPTVVDQVVESLRDAIHAGIYPPNLRLVEREVALSLGISTIAVREAFARLADDGLVVRKPRRGAIVAPVSARAVQELGVVSVEIECLAAEIAAKVWTQQQGEKAHSVAAEIAAAVQGDGYQQIGELDRQFRSVVWAASGNETLIEIAERLHRRLVHYLSDALRADGDVTWFGAATDYGASVAAIESGDPTTAALVTETHTRSLFDSIAARVATGEESVAAAGDVATSGVMI